MVAVGDAVVLSSGRFGTMGGKIIAPRPNDQWLVQYDNGQVATKKVTDRDVFVQPRPVREYENEDVIVQRFELVYEDGTVHMYESEEEIAAAVKTATYLGVEFDAFEVIEKVVISRRLIDAF